MTGLSKPQYAATVVVANVASILSVFGSFTICLAAWKKRRNLYHRLLLALSCTDVLSSTFMALHPWLMPRGTPNLVWAQGNDATCSAIGFTFVVFLLLVSSYNCLLSLMFLLTVRYKWKDEEFRNRLERPAHVVFMMFALFVGLSGVITDTFKPTIFVNACWIGDCSTFDLYNEGKCPEEVINYGWTLGWVSVAAVTLNTIMAIASTGLVYLTVRAQSRSNRAFEFQGTVNETANRRQKEVVNQAVCYTLVYFNTFIWIFIGGILLGNDVWLMEHEGEPALYTFQLLMWTFVPSQGALNFLVYTRPAFIKWRKAYPDRSALWALYKSASLESPPRGRAPRSPNNTSTSAKKSIFKGAPWNSLSTALQGSSSLLVWKRSPQSHDVLGPEQARVHNEEESKHVLGQEMDSKPEGLIEFDENPTASETDAAMIDQTNSSNNGALLVAGIEEVVEVEDSRGEEFGRME